MSHSIYHLVKFYEVEITVVLTFERSQQIAIVSFKQCLFTKHTIQKKKTWKSMCCKSRMIIKSRNKNTFIEKYQSNFSLNTPENYIPEMLTNLPKIIQWIDSEVETRTRASWFLVKDIFTIQKMVYLVYT